MAPTEEQQEFINHCMTCNEGMTLLCSPAGTGKSYVAGLLMKYLDSKIVFLAPTNKAKSILENSIKNGNILTIHRFFNSKIEYDETTGEKRFIFKPQYLNNSVIVVDECSMITRHMFDIFKEMSKNNHIIFMGDHLQLPPIEVACDEDDISNYTNNNSSISIVFKEVTQKFTFSKNMRSERLVSTLMLQQAREACHSLKMPYKLISKSQEDMLDIFYQNKDDSTTSIVVLAYTNVAVNNYNNMIRRKLFDIEDQEELKPFYEGEKLIFSGFRKENHSYFSSQEVIIKTISLKTITLDFKNCNCPDSEFKRVHCKTHKFRRGSIDIEFYSIILNGSSQLILRNSIWSLLSLEIFVNFIRKVGLIIIDFLIYLMQI